MSQADKIFKQMCTDIIENGSSTEGQAVRPKWEDGSLAYTIKQFGVCNKYDLRKEFPALTLRKTAIKSATDEILWIYQKKSNNIHDLNSHIWDEWADENGSIGKAYGYQVDQRFEHHKAGCEFNIEELTTLRHSYPSFYVNGRNMVELDQMDAVLYELKNAPFSRRIMTNLWNVSDLSQMRLQPCAFNATFNVTDEGYDKLVLNLVLNQRSQDILAANNWNVVQYSILLMMVAQVSDMIPGQLVHMITDAHIYDKHVDIIKELITREEYDAPIVTLNPEVKNFYDFTVNDVIIENYVTGPQIKNIPIAV